MPLASFRTYPECNSSLPEHESIVNDFLFRLTLTRIRRETSHQENDIISESEDGVGIFKACDIRGVYGRDLTPDIVYRIGRALGAAHDSRKFVMGGDVRTSTSTLKNALARGLTESGVDVTDIGIVPTPAFYFARRHLGIDAGVMVTASHNPPEFNGLKIALGRMPVTESNLLNIKKLVETERFRSGSGEISSLDVLPAYRESIKAIAPQVLNLKSFRVILDCGNGCYSDIAPDVFRDFGYQVEELFCEPDGTFPNRNPNSAVKENLSELCRRVKDSGAQLGIAFDGDGDRVSFVDDRGRFLASDKGIAILSGHVLERNTGGKVIYDLKCSSIVPESISDAGGIPIEERSGHTFIKSRMLTEDAVFGGEISGHYFYRELHGGDDGLYTALVMAGMLADSGMRLSDIADSVPEYEITPDIRVPYSGDRANIIERIAAGSHTDSVSMLDGVKIDFEDGWGLARVSVTEPVITLRFEARTSDRLCDIISKFLQPVPEIYEQVEKAIRQ